MKTLSRPGKGIVLLLVLVILLTGCGKGSGGSVKDAEEALARSGVRDVFFSKPDDPNYLKIDLESSYIYDEDNHYHYPELKIQSPVYTMVFDDYGGQRFSSAKAEGASFKDEDAMTSGTLIFMVSRHRNTKVYHNKKEETVVGYEEFLRVYLYDLSSKKFFADKTFYGEELKDSYDDFPSSKNSFINKADMDEVNAWIDTYR